MILYIVLSEPVLPNSLSNSPFEFANSPKMSQKLTKTTTIRFSQFVIRRLIRELGNTGQSNETYTQIFGLMLKLEL